MKTGTAHIDAIAITCPYCGEYHVSTRTGSQMFTYDDRDQLQKPTQTCSHCGQKFKTPALAKKM